MKSLLDGAALAVTTIKQVFRIKRLSHAGGHATGITGGRVWHQGPATIHASRPRAKLVFAWVGDS